MLPEINFFGKLGVTILAVALPFLSSGQLIVDSTKTPAQLVQNILLGAGVTASNIQYKGDPKAIGAFSGNTDLGIKSGILLTTGSIVPPSGPQGPNDQGWSGLDNSEPGDPLLNTISSATTYNAAILEFDFVPTSDTLKFKYVFGSDEYMEYANPGSSYNDVFAFTLSGVSVPMAAKNIALIPGTSTPVAILNVNLNNNPAWYHDNGDGSGSGTAPDGQYIQYDGFTKVLTAKSPVICGETYHIRIAIADAGDGGLDSGVFLEAGSFSTNGALQVSSNVSFGSNDTTLFEGCGSAKIVFKRPKNQIATQDTVNVAVTGTASNGTDYSNIPGNIIFPVGSDSVVLMITGKTDATTEGVESIKLTVNIMDPCTKQIKSTVVNVYITDFAPLSLNLSNDTMIYCKSSPITLSASGSGGTGKGFHYSWSNGTTGKTITVNPTGTTTTYYCTMSDTCGVVSVKDSVKVQLVNYPGYTVSISQGDTICSGDSVAVQVTVNGGKPKYKYSWDKELSDQPGGTVHPKQTTTYNVTVTDSCGNSDTKSVTVQVTTTGADFSYTGKPDFLVDFTNLSNSSAISYQWEFGDDSPGDSIKNPSHTYPDTGTYNVTLIVKNAEGCVDTIEGPVTIVPELNFYFPNSFTPNGDGRNDIFRGYGYGIKTYEMIIFNRWGEEVYRTNDINRGWDGKTNAGYVQNDTYICIFNIQGVNADLKAIKVGSVNLIR